jgi:hypothetical protein
MMRDIISLRLGLLAAVILSCFVGCSRSGTRPELMPVKGRVTLDGQPLAGAVVLFRAEAGGRGSRGTTGKDGRYELVYLRDIKGAQLGKHTVSITTAMEGSPLERVPAMYNRASTLTAHVPSPDNTIDFTLTSK